MKIATLLALSFVLLLPACTGEPPPVTADQSPIESVSLVLYYSDGDFDIKTTGEKALLSTGELVTVQRKIIRPSAELMTSDWNKRFLAAIQAPPMGGYQELKLDRANGKLCNSEGCAYIYSICPNYELLKAGLKCHSYPLK